MGPDARGVDPASLTGVDHIVHLAGSGIADKRWTDERVNELIASRSHTARLLLRAAQENGTMPNSFLSAAGVGYYGAVTGPHVFSEKDAAGTDIIARISEEWERAVDEWSPFARVVKLRTPVVLARQGGALPKLVTLARWGLAAPLGTGRQWMPWVHLDDLVLAYQQAIKDERMTGVYNVIGGNVTNADLTRAVARALSRPFFLPRVPSVLLKLLFGRMADILLCGSRASSEHLFSIGFTFEYVDLNHALGDLLRTVRS